MGTGLEVGAAVTIQHLIDHAQTLLERLPADQAIGLRELRRHGLHIAGAQVRSAGHRSLFI